MCSTDIFLGLLAVLFPPLPVWVKSGLCSADSVINILLCVLGYFPGLIHAWYIIAKYPDPPYDYEPAPDREPGRVTYVYVRSSSPHHHQQPQQPPQQHGVMNYGTQASYRQEDSGEGGSNGAPPPSYAQVIAGDHKIQTRD